LSIAASTVEPERGMPERKWRVLFMVSYYDVLMPAVK
jgi:hypothetical protein